MLLDEAIVNKLKNMQLKENQTLFTKMSKSYMTHAPKYISEIKEAFDDKDVQVIFQDSHSLKSSSAAIGALRLSELCKKIEAATQDKFELDEACWKDLRILSGEMQAEFNAVMTDLEKMLNE